MRRAGPSSRPALVRFLAWVLAVGLLSFGVLSTSLLSQSTQCTAEYFTFYPTEGVLSAAGGYGTMQWVKSTPSVACQTEAVSDSPWLLVLDKYSPFSWGTTRFFAFPNEGALAKVAHILVRSVFPTHDGTAFTVTQQAPEACVYAFDPVAPLHGAAGAQASFAIASTTGSPNCRWVATSDANWIKILSVVGFGNGKVFYDALPNFTPRARTGTITIGSQQILVRQQENTGTAEQRFVELLYFSFLDRLPSVAERDAQVAIGLRPPSTWTDLAMSFFGSDEFNMAGRFAAGLYVGLLNRDAEYTGWRWQRSAISKGWQSPYGLVEQFLLSPEYQLKFGNPDNPAFVRLLYRYVLLREATQGEVDWQVAALAGGTPRVALASAFLNSPEFRNGTGPRLTAFLLYATLFLRDTSVEERAFRANQIASGIPVRAIMSDLIASPEFQSIVY